MFSWIGDHIVGLFLFAGALFLGWKTLGWLSKRSGSRVAPVTIFCNKCGWKGVMGKTKRACSKCGSLKITLRTT
jgi:hypothetical protein